MIEYIYIVKCAGCEDEPFTFFDEAKEFALGRMSEKPCITQIEVNRNDFGECTDSCDLGTVWSWEDMMKDTATDAEPATSVFTKDDLKCMANGHDPEFDTLDNSIETESFSSVEDTIDFLIRDEEEAIAGYEKVEDAVKAFDVENKEELLDVLNHIKTEEEEHIEELEALLDVDSKEAADVHKRKPIPDGMTIAQLKEAMEENEDTVECAGCEELFPKEECFHKDDIGWLCSDCEDRIVKCKFCDELYDRSECRWEVGFEGWLCDRCQSAIMSRGETLTFREGNYFDFLDESALKEAADFSHLSMDDLFKALADMKKEFSTNCKVTIDEVNNFIANWKESSEPVKENYEQPESLDTLEEADDYKNHLALCPECGAEEGFDKDTGICIACGFNFEGV